MQAKPYLMQDKGSAEKLLGGEKEKIIIKRIKGWKQGRGAARSCPIVSPRPRPRPASLPHPENRGAWPGIVSAVAPMGLQVLRKVKMKMSLESVGDKTVSLE